MSFRARTMTDPNDPTVIYGIIDGGNYGCSDELSDDCLEGPFDTLYTVGPADYSTDERAVCRPCAKLLGIPTDELRKRL